MYKKAEKLIEANKLYLDSIMPQAEETILEAESLLNVKFPITYKKFLKNYGCLFLGSQTINGLYNNIIINDTLSERNDINDEFPLSYIVIHELGNGEISCIDTAQMNDENKCPIIAWYFGKKEKIANDFGDFLLEKVIWGLESFERDGKEINWLDAKR